MTTTSNTDKPYGYDLEVRFHDGTVKKFSKVGSAATVRRWAMLKRLAKEVTLLSPYTREQWLRTWGDGRIRM